MLKMSMSNLDASRVLFIRCCNNHKNTIPSINKINHSNYFNQITENFMNNS